MNNTHLSNRMTLGRRLGMALSVVLLTGGLLMQTAVAQTEARPTDDQIVIAVESGLDYDSSIPGNGIDVESTNGIVTLQGEVPNLLAKERAVAVVETIRGVRSIVNDLTVKPIARSDEQIRADVKASLLADPATDSYEIATQVKHGVVTLSGTVNSWQEKQLSGAVAMGVKGVKEINNTLTVDYAKDRPDSEIEADVQAALQRDPWIDDLLLTATVQDGTVTIDGIVGSLAEKRRVRGSAWVNGVVAVNDVGVDIEPWAADTMQRKTKTAFRSDAEIERAVNDSLLFDPRVFSFNPTVSVDDGVVTLTGTVDNLKAKHAAAQNAGNTPGVWRVKNLLKVRSTDAVTDGELVQNAIDAIERDPYLERFEVGVTARNGTVHLGGTVDSFYEKAHAEDVVSRLNGVVEVNNNLAVSYPAYTYYYWPHSTMFYEPHRYNRSMASSTWHYETDAEVQDDIENELFWSPFVNSNHVNVAVNNGVATLTGTVSDWNEYSAATENAWEGGARGVINELRVN